MSLLAQQIFSSPKFQEVVSGIRLNSLRVEFPMLDFSDERIEIDWNYAILCSSILASIDTEQAQNAVLRITTACLSSTEVEEAHKRAATLLLERVGNLRSVELAESRNLVQNDTWKNLPPLLRLETIRKRLELSIPLSTGENLAVNPFQSAFWTDAEDHDWISVSAPTSAGKSRIVREWFLEKLRRNDRYTAVYLAPTRALVEEVSAEFRAAVPSEVGVFAVPWHPELDKEHRRIFVVTQERLHLIQQSHRPFEIDLLFVDEAQSLGSDDRGVLLQQVIDRAKQDAPGMKTLFASPLSSNPEIFLEEKPEDASAKARVSETVTVSQNLLWVESVPRKPAKRTVSLIHEGQNLPVATFELKQRATRVPMRIAYVAHALGGYKGGNIVYVNGAAEAEKVALNIADLKEEVIDSEIIELQELIRAAVHPKYSLVDVVAKGVAFHYGNMPLAIRTEIERLFSAGKIEFLVCTSTLLEGVNLPCRTIFMRNPQKGRGNPLSEADFWNLAGRAGRWGKEFEGNIVCVDTNDKSIWPILPTERRRSELKVATYQGLDEVAPLLQFIRDDFNPEKDSNAEYLFSYLAVQYVSGGNVSDLLSKIKSDTERAEVERAIELSLENTDFPLDLVPRHAGIGPVAMQRLLEDFRASGQDPWELTLPLPEEPDSRERYQAALVRLGASMTTAFGGKPKGGTDRRKWQLANLVVNWMNGMPLSRLIDQRISGGTSIGNAIRGVMADIETIARFQAPKYLACYLDVLSVYAAERGIHDVGHQQDISMLLELGVSRPSEVVLMSLGLSRTATISLSDYVTVDSWTTSECVQWLARQNIEGMDIPVLTQKEIMSLINQLSSE